MHVDRDLLIVGAGFSGLYAIHRARSLGFTAHVFEAADGVGGTWYWNRYPGARCDVESLNYSYSFSPELEQEWHWSERYAGQPEILRYLEHVADRFDLRRDISLRTRVTAARFDEDAQVWRVTTETGDDATGRFLMLATGCLSVPKMPEIPGLERFRGEAYHTGLWPHEPVSFAGKRVGVLGTGSSAVQAIPVIAEDAASVTVLQRSPNFSIPSWNGPLAPAVEREHKARYRELRDTCRRSSAGNPWFARPQSILDAPPEEREAELERRYRIGGFFFHSAYCDLDTNAEANEIFADFVRRKIRERVADPAVGELLCPYDHPLATKRMCIDIDYFETYNLPHVRLVDVRATPLVEFTETGLETTAEAFAFDLIVLATGFDAMTGAALAIDLSGRDGQTLRGKWANGPRAHLGLAHAGFPNLFTITGPGSPSVISNMVVSIEQHVEWVTDCMAYLRTHDRRTIEPTVAAEDAWVEHVQEVGDQTLYPRASSWYMGANIAGKPRGLLPYVGGVGRYREHCTAIAERDYEGFVVR